MADFSIGDVWGVGRASQAKLLPLGIEYAGQLRDMEPKRARGIMTVVGEKIVHELNGRSCMKLEAVAPQASGLRSDAFLQTACHDKDRDGAGRCRLCHAFG